MRYVKKRFLKYPFSSDRIKGQSENVFPNDDLLSFKRYHDFVTKSCIIGDHDRIIRISWSKTVVSIQVVVESRKKNQSNGPKSGRSYIKIWPKLALSFYTVEMEKKRGEISCNKVECSIIKIEESYGPPAVKGSACEFDPIVVASLFPLDMHCTLSK